MLSFLLSLRVCAKTAYWIMWLLVLAVSIYDSILIHVFRADIMDFELNPVGRTLIAIDGGEVRLFLFTKAVGTITALAALSYLYRKHRRIALPVIAPVAVFQLILFWVLTFAVPAPTSPHDHIDTSDMAADHRVHRWS